MAHLLSVTRKGPPPRETFPFSIPAVRSLERLDLGVPVTFFVGENGSGKSTVLEALACAAELPAMGGEPVSRDASLAGQRDLAKNLRLAWSVRSRKGFFLRAEDFFGYLKSEARTDARIAREEAERLGIEPPAIPSEDGHLHVDESRAAPYLARHDARSHGESFMDLFAERIGPGGLYLLDEPEAPLSPQRQLAFLALLARGAREGAQFVIATHSPILLAYPKARIYSFDRAPVSEVAYDDLEHVVVTRDFLNHRAIYLAKLLD